MKNNHQFRLKLLKNKRRTSGAMNKLSFKSITLPEVYTKDDSTISYVKRVGGQIFQNYSLKDTDIRAQDNFKYYYLISEMYPAKQEGENVTVLSEGMDVKIRQIKMENFLTDSSFSSTGFKANDLDIRITIIYSTYYFVDDNVSSKPVGFSMDNKYVIKYTNLSLPNVDTHYALGKIDFSFSSMLYSIVTENFEEHANTYMTDFSIKVI